MTQITANRDSRKSKKVFAPSLLALALGFSVLLPINAEAGCNVKCAFRKVAKPVKTVANGGIKFATTQGQQLASFTQDEFNNVRSTTNSLVNETSTALNNAYNTAISGMAQFFSAEIERLLRQQGKSFISKNSGTVNRISTSVAGMTDQARAAIKRIVKAMPNKQVTQDVMADLQLVSKELGFADLGGSAKTLPGESLSIPMPALALQGLPLASALCSMSCQSRMVLSKAPSSPTSARPVALTRVLRNRSACSGNPALPLKARAWAWASAWLAASMASVGGAGHLIRYPGGPEQLQFAAELDTRCGRQPDSIGGLYRGHSWFDAYRSSRQL